jgi:DNA-binding NtrC family response regulator
MNFSRDTSGREGLALLARLRERHPELPVILITAWGSIALAVEGIKAGAADFITKPWSNELLLQSVRTALSLADDRARRAGAPVPSRDSLDARFDLRDLVGRAPAFVAVLDLIGRVAPTDAAVLITGESGTGKELAAEAIHRNSRRASSPFVKVNLGGISSTLFESEMFGHVRGAFTDARADRKGRFEMADGGTIFLDEIGELEQASQVKLLRVLQDRTYEVLGSSRARRVDVRVVSATNRDLAQAVGAGTFREDLFYRLNLIALRLPALRERPGDVALLARHLIERFAAAYGRPGLALEPEALARLERRAWPGNVRQLKQTLERAVLMTDGSRLTAGDLDVAVGVEGLAERSPALPAPGAMTLDELERAMIEKCLRHYDGNVTRVAEALGLSRAALYRRFQKYAIDPER